MKTAQTTIYAKGSGLEIAPHEKRGAERPPEGRISLRFFRLEEGSTAIRFIAEPAEAFELFRKIGKVHGEGGREALTHRFEGTDGEVQTRLTVERYGSGEKMGYAFTVQRGAEKINVPVGGDRFLYAAEFLRHLSVTQAWVGTADPTAG